MSKLEKIILAGGCFWCTEAVFQKLKGVTSVIPGYSGGEIANPTYEQVSSGKTGHAETIQITFDPKIIPLQKILEVFFATHDPTTLNRQGADIGTQYRSVIFYLDEVQKKLAEETIKDLQPNYQSPIITKVEPLKNFYPAEDYHKNYFENNRSAPYCQLVIDPKIQKLYKEFKNLV